MYACNGPGRKKNNIVHRGITPIIINELNKNKITPTMDYHSFSWALK